MIKILIFNALMLMHPLHVTLTTINQDQGNDTLKVFFRMYYDDFLKDYRLFDPDFNSTVKNDTVIIPDDQIAKYFNSRVQIYINRKLLDGRLEKIENESYEVRLRMVYLSDKRPRNFRIRNHVLTAVYSDQSNMIFININGFEDAMKLTVDHIEEDRSFK